MPSSHRTDSRRGVGLPIRNASSSRETPNTSREQGDRRQLAFTNGHSICQTQNQSDRNHSGELSLQGASRSRPADQYQTYHSYVTASSSRTSQSGYTNHPSAKQNKYMLEAWSSHPETHEARSLGIPSRPQDVNRVLDRCNKLFPVENNRGSFESRK